MSAKSESKSQSQSQSSTAPATPSKRRSYSLFGLLELIPVLVLACLSHARALAQRGWGAQDTERLGRQLEALSRLAETRREAKRRSSERSHAVAKKAEQAATLRRLLIHALKIPAAQGTSNINPELLKLTGVQANPRPLIKWFAHARGVVVAHESAVAARLGADVIGQFDEMHAGLESAYQQHRHAYEALAASTRATAAAAAVAIASVEELNQVARIAFDRKPALLKQFSKKTLPFSKKTKEAAPPGEPAANDDAAKEKKSAA